jgi:dihydrolipoamide dehydrogenase
MRAASSRPCRDGPPGTPPLSDLKEVRIPALGDFSDVPVIAVIAKPGDRLAAEDPLITLESDKATMDVPAPFAGVVGELTVKVGDRVSEGDLIARMTPEAPVSGQTGDTIRLRRPELEPAADSAAPLADAGPAAPPPAASATAPAPAEAAAAAPRVSAGTPAADRTVRLVVIGAGPGGYTAAFRAADLGLGVMLIERDATLGGVCLNVGCIPSKALLHGAKLIDEVESMASYGLAYGSPEIDTDRLRAWKNRIVSRLTSGLSALAKQRKVEVLRGEAKFIAANRLAVATESGTRVVAFENCIIAVGSAPARLGLFPDDPRVVDSTEALELKGIPERLLVVGGGIIGLEMAGVYAAFGSKVSVVELTPGLMPGCDRDLVRPLEKRLRARYQAIYLDTRVTAAVAEAQGIRVSFAGATAPEPQLYDRVLVAVGRRALGNEIDAVRAGVAVDSQGLIRVDRQMRTNVPHIFAIGDVVGGPMLAHKASHEGKVAAEVAAGQKSAFDARAIPSVAFTDPEIAWAGLTETAAADLGIRYQKGAFPWIASGRSLTLNREEGFSKLLFDPDTDRVLGAGIVGTSAGELISEVALAIELGADAADIALTVHPHPTLSETVAFAAEAFEGTLTDLYQPRRS